MVSFLGMEGRMNLQGQSFDDHPSANCWHATVAKWAWERRIGPARGQSKKKTTDCLLSPSSATKIATSSFSTTFPTLQFIGCSLAVNHLLRFAEHGGRSRNFRPKHPAFFTPYFTARLYVESIRRHVSRQINRICYITRLRNPTISGSTSRIPKHNMKMFYSLTPAFVVFFCVTALSVGKIRYSIDFL